MATGVQLGQRTVDPLEQNRLQKIRWRKKTETSRMMRVAMMVRMTRMMRTTRQRRCFPSFRPLILVHCHRSPLIMLSRNSNGTSDALPVYEITHTIRLLVITRCETSLTWDQLRSPQVSQFLVKPIQQQIRASQFSRATLYALMANCLQFEKEAYTNPGNSGTSRTRGSICELLAIKLLKEFTTRELVSPRHGNPRMPFPAANSSWQIGTSLGNYYWCHCN